MCHGLYDASSKPESFRNFGQNIKYAKAAFAPSSVTELEEHLAASMHDKHACFMPVGAMHSWGQVVAPERDCERVSLEKLKSFVIDSCRRTLTVEAGVRFKEVLPILQSKRLALSNYGAIMEQTFVGAVMTSTHGSGQTPSLANMVSELKVLPASGRGPKVLKPGRDAEAAGWLNALGGLGFVVKLQFDLVDDYNLDVTQRRDLSRDELGDLMLHQVSRAGQAGSKSFSWIIYSSEKTNVFERRVKIDAPASHRDFPITPIVDPLLQLFSQSYTPQKLLGYPLAKFFFHLTRTLSSIGVLAPGVYQGTSFLPNTHHDENPHVEMELFIPPEDLSTLLQVFDDKLRDCKECSYFHVYYLIIRSIMPDQTPIWMSPFQKSGPRISVSFLTYLKLDGTSVPEEKLSPFTMFCGHVLTELVCNLNMRVRYHRGKYIAPAWVGALELEEDFKDSWKKYLMLQNAEDPGRRVHSQYLQLYGERMASKYRACPQAK